MFSYYGGKWRISAKLPAPKHDVVVEPFAGGAGYSLRYEPRKAILFDLSDTVCGVWDYLINVREEEILGLPDLPLDGSPISSLGVTQEQGWLMGYWANKAKAEPSKRAGAWHRRSFSPRHYGSLWSSRTRHRISSHLHKIRDWEIHQADYTKADVGPATYHIDPPYQVKGTHYTHSSKDIDFDALGEWCRSLKGQVMVCENEGATWLPFQTLGEFKTSRDKGGENKSKEVVWFGGE